MNILFATSELTPFAKTGGLGDVAAALPAALRLRGHSISIVMPLYRQLRERLPGLQPTSHIFEVPLGGSRAKGRLWHGISREGVRVVAVERDEFFDRRNLYGNEDGDYDDNAARYLFFCKAVLEVASKLSPRPQILHLNDWQTAAVAPLALAGGHACRTVLTIHNLAYQGVFAPWDFDLTGLPSRFFNDFEFYGRINMMKGAILHADHVTTVSPTYAKEILTEKFGCGLEGVLASRAGNLTGILNGVDVDRWDPARDSFLAAPYDSGSMAGKKKCKQALLSECGWKMDAKSQGIPVFGCVARLVSQKGLDLILAGMEAFLQTGARLVLLGSGDKSYEDAFTALARSHPGQVWVKIGFDEGLAHRIEAGSDFFLMPSQFEPCGLNQMYSLRYGTIPVVHDTGGLADSVEPWDASEGTGTGFVFSPYSLEAYLGAVRAALKVKANAKSWRQLRMNGMARDFSWEAVAPAYEEVYRKVTGI